MDPTQSLAAKPRSSDEERSPQVCRPRSSSLMVWYGRGRVAFKFEHMLSEIPAGTQAQEQQPDIS